MVVNRLNTNVMDRKIDEVSLVIEGFVLFLLCLFSVICMTLTIPLLLLYGILYAVHKELQRPI